MARKQGFKKIALASDIIQTKRLKFYAKKYKLEVDFIPIEKNILQSILFRKIKIDPKPAYVENFESLKERTTFFERFLGTIRGKLSLKVSLVKIG